MKIKVNRIDGQGESQTLVFKPNISYTKERNVIERFIQCSKFYLRQATNRVFTAVKSPLTYFQNNLLYAQIGAILNSVPYNVNSKLSPGILHRSESKIRDFDFSKKASKMADIQRICNYTQAFKEELSNFFRSDINRIFGYLNPNSRIRMKVGDAVFYYHNPDSEVSQIMFGVIEKFQGSDVEVRCQQRSVLLSRQRIFLFAPSDF